MAIVLFGMIQIQLVANQVHACEARNTIIEKFEAFVDKSFEGRQKLLRATVASPKSTPAQKIAAQRMLNQIRNFIINEHQTLVLEDCNWLG